MAKSSKKVTKNEAVETATAEQAAPETTLEPVQLTVADLQILGRIIELASRRGAFQAGELSQVGESYNKLASFLAYVESVQKKEADATASEEGAEVASEDAAA